MNRAIARRSVARLLDRALATSDRRARTGIDRNPKPLTVRHRRAADRAERGVKDLRHAG